MQWSFKIASLFGIPIKLHVTFLLLLFWVASKPSGLTGLIAFGLVFVCVVLHELGHSLTARKFGIPVEAITLLPIGGVAQMRSLPRSAWCEFLVAIAGPAVSVALGVLFFYLTQLFYSEYTWQAILSDSYDTPLLGEIASINFFLAAFNLVPAFPMDGGRILRSILWSRKGFFQATAMAAKVGKILAVLCFFTAVFTSHTMLIVVAMFIYFGADTEANMVAEMQYLMNTPVAQAMQSIPHTLQPDNTIHDAAVLMAKAQQTHFPVMHGPEPAGVLTEPNLFRAIREKQFDRPVADFMTRQLICCRPSDSLAMVMHLMDKRNLPCVLVVDNDTIVGIVTPEQGYQAGKNNGG